MMNNENISQNEKNFETTQVLEADIESIPTNKPSKLLKILKKPYIYLSLCFILPVVVMYLIYVAMGIHPFGEGSVLVLDLNGQYVYFFEALRRFVYGDASLIYSFSRALGGEFMGIYAYYVASPLSYIVALFPKERILEALLCLFLLKTGTCGLTFGYYLHKTSKKVNRVSVICFSMLYALSSYCIVQQHNTMWIDAVMWLPLVALGLESLIKYKKFKMFTFFLALTVFSNFYIGYMVCIFVAVYFFYYYFAHSANSENNPLGEKLHFISSLSRTVLYSMLACGMAMVIILTAYYSLTMGKTTFTNPNFDPVSKIDFIDILTKFFPASYDTVRPEGWPFIYCGVLTLFLVPVFFLSKNFSSRQKIFAGALIIFFILSFSLSTADLVWHGFQRPNWLNYRYSFMLCFILLVLAYKASYEIKNTSSGVFIGIAAALSGFLFLVQKLEYENLQDIGGIWLSLFFIGLTLILLCLLKKPHLKETIAAIMVIFICLETFCNGLSNCLDLHDDVYYSKYSSYNNYIAGLRPIVEEIKENDTSFYRFEKTKHRKTNDNMTLGIRGLSNSTSTLNAETIRFLNRMGYASKSHWSKYLGGTPVSDSLLGIKYIISSDDWSRYYDAVYGTQEDAVYTTYLNPYALSLAYGVDKALFDTDMESEDTPPLQLNKLLSSLIGEEIDVFIPVELSDYTTYNMDETYISGHYKYTPENTGSDGVIYYNYEIPKSDVEYYFYLPSDYPREVKLKLNGVPHNTFYGNETSRIVTVGSSHKEGDKLRIQMTAVKSEVYIKTNVPSLYYLDMETFKYAIGKLAETQYEISSFTESSFDGTITTKTANKTILTTIPYDEGWQIYLDGKRVEYKKALNALIAFEIDEIGEHTLTMNYMPKAFVLGASCTVLSVILFAALCLWDTLKKRRGVDTKNTAIPAYSYSGREAAVISETLSEEDAGTNTDETEKTEGSQDGEN
ncbi:MAG: YfhO family protein [Clostridia bacterium]|nr:YfhO family protein [Clostridia bacterium]